MSGEDADVYTWAVITSEGVFADYEARHAWVDRGALHIGNGDTDDPSLGWQPLVIHAPGEWQRCTRLEVVR
jgi:hypothetical protein